MTTEYVQSDLQALSSKQKPERALIFLELLNTDKTLANMVHFELKMSIMFIMTKEGDITISPRNKDIASYVDLHITSGMVGSLVISLQVTCHL